MRIIQLINWLGIFAAGAALSACDESRKTNPGAASGAEISQLAIELKTNNGGPAYADLLHRAEDGFEIVSDALAANEITPDHYISFDYDLKTRWDDGPSLAEKFESYMFSRAENSDAYAQQLAGFFKAFPLDELEEMKKDPRAGMRKVAILASQEHAKPTPPLK